MIGNQPGVQCGQVHRRFAVSSDPRIDRLRKRARATLLPRPAILSSGSLASEMVADRALTHAELPGYRSLRYALTGQGPDRHANLQIGHRFAGSPSSWNPAW